jgi:hypothetical protein
MANDHQPDGNDAKPAAPALSAQGAARRRMAGLGISGVVMTVASNNALADMVCKAPSGALSGNLNSHSPKTTCDGRSPEWWLKNKNVWPSGTSPNDLFVQHFPSATQPLANKTLEHVLKQHGTDKDGVAMHLVATYLNVRSERITFLTRQSVIDMYARWKRDQSYTPAAGAEPWNGAAFADYLAHTQAY